MSISTDQLTDILDRVRNPLDAGGIQYTGICYDPLVAVYEINLHTEGYYDREGNPDPHRALLAMRAALKKAGYMMVTRVSGYSGGFWFVRFTLERAV